MDQCFRCRQPMWPSADFTVKTDSETRIVETVACFNPECQDFAYEYYEGGPNIFYRVNRAIEGKSVSDVVREMGLSLDRSVDLDALVRDALMKFPDQAKTHKAGKKDLSGFFVGQIMRDNKSVDPKALRETILRVLSEE
jgi:hypothetical protein